MNTVLLLGALQGLLLALAIPFLSQTNKRANTFLVLLLIAASLSLLLFLSINVYQIVSPLMIVFLDTFAFLFAPLIYVYIKKLLFPVFMLSKKHLLHALPAFLHFVYGVSLFGYSHQNFNQPKTIADLRIQWAFIFSLLVILTIGYCWNSLRLVLLFRKKARKVVSYTPKIVYLSLFLACTFLGNLICILFALDFFFHIRFFPFTDTYIGWTLIPFLVYAISYFTLFKPEVITLSYTKEKLTAKRMERTEIDMLKTRLECYMEHYKPHTDPKLSLASLAGELNSTATKLSWLINNEYGCNFYDFINRYRVSDFVEKLKNKEHHEHTLLSLAYDVGFNSKTTFNKAFKKTMDHTPTAYLNKLNRG